MFEVQVLIVYICRRDFYYQVLTQKEGVVVNRLAFKVDV